MSRFHVLLCVLLACVLISGCRTKRIDTDAANASQQCLERLKKLGAKLEYHKNGNLKSLDLVGLEVDDAALDGWEHFKTLESVVIASDKQPNDRVTDAAVAKLSGIATLKTLDLIGTAATGDVLPKLQNMNALATLKMSGRISGDGLKSLEKFPALRSVVFDRSDINDDDLAEIAKAKRLVGLFLAYTKVTDNGMPHLASLTSLHNLRLGNTAVTDEGMKPLVSLKALINLDLSNTQVGDAGLATLVAAMPQLERLNLYMTQVTDVGADSLTALGNLNWLNLDACRIGDVSVPKLATLKKLTFLHLGSTDVSDLCIDTLKTMPHVKELYVTRTNITRAGAESLIAALPHDCNVYVDKVE